MSISWLILLVCIAVPSVSAECQKGDPEVMSKEQLPEDILEQLKGLGHSMGDDDLLAKILVTSDDGTPPFYLVVFGGEDGTKSYLKLGFDGEGLKPSDQEEYKNYTSRCTSSNILP
ncbi:hypothetical protein DICVIV_09657 [Dictyocaulus viviparus]|uniref:Uncharacterized protein n=1 Tax=Dictyocaulus viviparus TaxID=29172 RepID=A0A0D8XI38_DICVI|nr:hypothetical protein DICVIV_09657 [Dictyocaulus viviparus]